MRTAISAFLLWTLSVASAVGKQFECRNVTHDIVNGCVTFSVNQGTGCAWMCNYCALQLGTDNYYFTDGVCTYQSGVGCVGNPYAGVSYTCCSN